MKNEIYIFLRGSMLMLMLIAGVSLRVYAQPCPTAPTISGMTFSPADPCLNQNHSIVNVTIAPSTPGTGYEYRYSLDGSPSFANSLPGGIPVGPHCITVAVFATTNVVCDGNNYGPGVMIPGTSVTYTLYFGTAGPPAIPRASIIGNLTCAPTISVVPNPLYSCYTYEYSIDGGPYSSTIPASLSRGCHTISYQLVSNAAGNFGCGSGSPTPASGTTDFSLFDDLFNIPNASLSVNRTCSDGTNGVVTSISGLPPVSPGLTYEYSFNMQPYTTSLPTNLAPGCYNIMIRQVADCPGTTGDGTSPPECRKDINFVVFPTPPVITAPSNTCDAMFALPSVTPVPGFVVQYSIDGGAWESNPSTTTPGCHSVRARYVTAVPCGSLPFNIVPAESFSDGVISACTDASNSVEVVIFPAAPVITPPANTCASAFTLPTVPAVAGFTVQYSINGGTWTASPIVPTTPGCYNVRARYVLSAVCGATAADTPGFGACAESNTVNVVIFPTAPIITAPTNTCNAPFTLPTVPAIAGFTVEYRIDNTTAGTTGTFSTSPAIPSAAACYAVTARYVLAADCGTAPENVIAAGTPGMGACANSNTVNVVVFPAAPTLTQPASTCNAMFTLPSAPAVDGFVVEYELDGSGSWSASPSTTVAGCHTVRARYALAAACGGTPAGASSADPACAASAPVSALIYPTAPVITPPANTCAAAFTLPAVPPFAGFSVEYRIVNISSGSLIDWTSTPVVPTTAGCYSIQARYVNTAACGTVAAGTPGTGACGASNIVNVVIFPPASSIFWDPAATQTATTVCGNAFPFTIYVLGTFFPPGFDFQISLDNGVTWLPVGTYPSNTPGPGCYRVVVRWVLVDDCGSTLAGTAGTGACAVSNTLDLLNIPDAPVITAPANTCASMFTLPDVTPIPGFNVQYSIDNGATWSASPSTTDAGCYSVRARYVSANACGSIPADTAGPAPCNQSNAVQVVIFPAVTATPGPVTKGATCGTTNVTFTWSGPAPAATITQNGATFELRYAIDGGAFSNTSGTFTGVTPGCHTIEARYVLTTACGATAAGTVAPANCGVQREFIIWLNLDGVPLTVDLVENCGATTNISSITLGGSPSVPAGQELVYVYRINGGPLNGPVTLAQLQAVDFPPGCHQVRVRVRATVDCGVGPDGAVAGTVAPNVCQSNVRNFVTFPEPPAISVEPICEIGNLVVNPDVLPPAGFQWRYRLINTTTGTEVVVNNWQASSTFTSVPVGCYRVEAVPVRTDVCGLMDPALAAYEPGAVYPSNIHRPLNNQTAAIIDANPTQFDAACVSTADAFVLPAPPMAITPNNITVCLGETGKIDLQYFEQMVPACLVDPVTGLGPATIEYIVTSSDPLVVVPGTLPSLPFNQPELMWMGENGENFPNVVTIGVTPRITLDGVSCDGAEVKFSITVQPNFLTDAPWLVNPNTAVQCEDNNGWIFHTGFNTPPDVNGFNGPFAPANWVFSNNGGDGTVDVSGAPNSIGLTSSNNGVGANTTYCITLTSSGTITFDWQYETNDSDGPFWDAFGVSINGVITQLTVNAGPAVQSGTYVSPVLNAGDEFCFVQASVDGLFGSATTISNMFLFEFEPEEVNTTPGCTYELYYNLSTSPLAEPIGNALVQTIVGDGNPVSFQPVFVPGTYQIWQRCGGCAELVATFNVSTVAQPELTDQLIEACPVTPGANTGLFEGIEYILPSVPAPQTLTVEGYYQTFNGAVNGGATGLISATGDFDYNSSDATIYVRIGHDVDGLPGIDCYYVGTIELRVVNRPIVILTAQDNPACIQQNVTLTANVQAGSGSGYTFVWERVSPDPEVFEPTTSSISVSETVPGQYVYRVTVTDPNIGVNGADGPACITIADITVTFVGPIITCPADFTASTDAGACNTYVNLVPAAIHHVCVDEFEVRYWVTGATTIGSADAPVTLTEVHAVPFNTGVNTVHAVAGTFFLNEFIPLDLPEAECSYTVTVLDREPPIARCKDVTVFLNAAGQAIVTADMVNGGSSDNCGVVEAFICPEVEGFTGLFDVSNWIFNNNGGDGTVDLSNAPNAVSLTGNNAGGGVNTTFCITIPANGTLAFSWDYTTLDVDGPLFDPFGVIINGFPIVLTDDFGPSSQSGSYSVTLSAGDEFCFNQSTIDGILGAGTTISNLFLFTSNQLPCTYTCENVGQNDVVLVVRDAAGNASSCIANVTVVDAIAPTLVCPDNIVQNVDPDTGCTWTSEVLEPVTLTDNCGVASLSYTIMNPDQTLVSGSGPVDDYDFGKGTSVVTYTAIDVNGNSSVCSFTVTVIDNVAPQFANCPDNITINLTNAGFTVLPTAPVGGFDISIPTTGNGCAVNLGYTAPTASDNCPMFLVQLVNGKGSAIQTYLAGTHTETYVVTDMSGNTAICSFTITVNDTRDPFITCPADVTVGTDPSFGCTASVPLQPTFGDNCNVVNVSHYYTNGTNAPSQLPSGAVSAATATPGFTSGLFYPGVNGVSGTTVVTFIATDVAGNTSSCSVNVTVVDDDAPFIMCPVDITLNANATCQGVLSAPYAPMVADNCGGAGLTVTYVIEGATSASSAASGVNPVPVTQTFNLGVSFITFTVTDAAGNTAKCTATVTVLDRTAPVLTCPTVQPVYNTPANQCFVALNLVATATDNCSVASINYFNPSFNAGANASGNYAPGFYTIDWVATDGSGNTSVCSVSFEVRDVIAPVITCPGNATLTTGAGNTTCTAQYNWTHPAPTDNCAVTSYSYRIELPNGSIVGPLTLNNLLVPTPPASAYNASYNFPLGTSRVRYYVSDARGNQTICFFDVTVSDDTPPVFISCPVNFTATNAVDLCASVVNWANPIATDNCGPVTVVRTDTNPAQGTIWPTGNYTVTYLATDANNNTAVCTFTINVIDTQNPNVFCPSVTQTFQTNPGTCTWNSAGSNAVSPRFQFDNCPYTLTYTITGATTASGNNDATGTVFNLGTSTVTYTIMEANGSLIGQCSFNIVVVDAEAPEITCSMVGALPSQPWINEFHYDNVGTDVGEFIEIAGPIGFDLSNCAIVLYNGSTPSAAVVYNTTTLTGTIPSPQTGTPVINGAFDGVGTWGNALATADGVAGWAGANAQALYMTEDNTYYYLGAQVSAAAWQTWGFLINTRPGGGTSDSWLRQITYGHADAPDYIFRGTFGGYAEFHTYNSMTSTWQGIGSSIPGTEFNANPGGFVEVRIPKSTIGVDRIKNVQFFITGDNNSHGTFDAVPNDEIVTSWNPANKTVLDNYANAPMFGYVVVNYPQDGIQNGPNDGMALVCNGMVLQLLSYEGPFTAANGPAAGMTSVDVVVSQQPAPAAGTSLQFQGAGTVGTWVGPITSTPGQINTGQSIVPTGSIVNNAPGQCGAVVTGIFATATDNCTANPAITNNSPYGTSNASGFYAVGNHTVTFTATDASGNTSQCSVSFTVRDVEAPQVNCTSIAPMTPQMTELFVCERQFNWLHPIPTDNCAVTVYTYSITNPDGTIAGPFTLAQVLAGGSRNAGYDFEKGTSTVTYFVQDAAGNTGSCSFNITVVDQQMPYFANCPTMIMSGNDVDRCDAKVNWTIPHAFDNCTLPVTVSPLPGNQYVPGAVIPVGTHTIGYIATDSDGNTAVCTFQIIVNDTQKPDIFPGKPQNVTVECDNIPAPLVLNANDVRDNCDPNPVRGFTQTSTQNPNPALCGHYNYTLDRNWTVTDNSGNVQLWNQIVTVRDTKAPEITVPLDVTVQCNGQYTIRSFTCNAGLGQYAPTVAQYSVNGVNTGIATAVDNCAPNQFICIEFTETFTPGSCGFTGLITRTWTATDPCGNRSQGVQRITIVDTTPPSFTCQDITVNLDATGNVTISAGQLIVGGIAAVVENCSATNQITFQLSKSQFNCTNIGVNQVLLVVTDACGNSAACQRNVTVRDVTPPVITCPASVTISLQGGECVGYFTSSASATDNCGASITYSPNISQPFPIGVTTVVATATDLGGNTATCSFTVTVREHVPTTNALACNNNVNLSLDGNCEAVIRADMILEGNNYRCYDRYCISIQTLTGQPKANFFTLADVGKTFRVMITDCEGSNNTCWGFVTIEEKLIPEIECPANLTVSCAQDLLARNVQGRLITGEAKLITCEPGATITFQDNFVDNGQCAAPRGILYRTWRVTDLDGNSATCVQTITVRNLDLNDIVWPADRGLENPIECSDAALNPALTTPAFTGWPTLNGIQVNRTGNLCMVALNVTDEIYDVCPGSYEILRTWKVRNMCLPVGPNNPATHIQVIKVLDTKGPKIAVCPSDTIISVDPWGCTASSFLPVPEKIEDLCSNVSFKATLYGPGQVVVTGSVAAKNLRVQVRNVPKGSHVVQYEFTDECGNKTYCIFTITVRDFVAPVAIAKRDIVIGLVPGFDGQGVQNAQAKLFAESVDNGSFDNCSNIRLEVRRPVGPACGNDGLVTNPATGARHNNNRTFNNRLNLPNYSPNDTDGGEFVKFCCEDIDAIVVDANGDGVIDELDRGFHEVILRVWDDGNMNGIIGDAGDNWNETWAYVKVEAKVPPVITCPDDATIHCDWAIQTSTTERSITGIDFTKTGIPSAYGVCSTPDIRFRDVLQLNQCGIGTITRTFTITDLGITRQCQQRITVAPSTSTQQWVVTPPSSSIVDVACDGPTEAQIKANQPTWVNGPCDVIGISTKIHEFEFEDGVCKKWVVEYKLVNWCTNQERGPFTKMFVYKDVVPPTFETCRDTMFGVDANCEIRFLTLTKKANDTGGCIDNGWIKWVVIVDLWADGTPDYEWSSFLPVGNDVNNANTGNFNAIQDNNGNGIKDIYLAPTANGGTVTIRIPEPIVGKMSNHKVTWKATDGCHNYVTCHEDFMVTDKKPPTPVCVPLSTALMADPDGAGPMLPMVELWAIDFNVKSTDNCTDEEDLLFTFDNVAPQVTDKSVFNRLINIDIPHYFDKTGGLLRFPADMTNAAQRAIVEKYMRGEENTAGNGVIQLWNPAQRSSARVWTSNALTPGEAYADVNVMMSVWDKKFNVDFCWTSLKLICNTCGPTGNRVVSGVVATEGGQTVSEVTVSFNTNMPEYPRSLMTGTNGQFAMSVPAYMDYDVTAAKDNDYNNGVSTLDLVLIQRHILDLQKLDSPYKLIAADATNDRKVTAADITEIRKLILGVTDKYANNTSWRFPISDQTMSPDSPWPFMETIRLNALDTDKDNQNFVAVKVGDVNGSATVNVSNPILEPRTSRKVNFAADDRFVNAGETVTVAIRGNNFTDVHGFQFTMNLNDARFGQINSGILDINANNIGVLASDKVTFSFASRSGITVSDDEVLFTLVLTADKAAKLSEMIRLTSDVTRAEAYTGQDLKVSNVSLTMRSLTPEADYPELYQNEPNPFRGATTVSYYLPEASKVVLTVYDATGRVVTVRKADAIKGMNSEVFTKEQLGVAGVLYYKLESGEFTATKKMIVIE